MVAGAGSGFDALVEAGYGGFGLAVGGHGLGGHLIGGDVVGVGGEDGVELCEGFFMAVLGYVFHGEAVAGEGVGGGISARMDWRGG